jgi:PTH2 family peptidyl-tRNA hydrolase
MDTKQVILVRKDLEMPPGKVAAQVAHASMGVILNEFRTAKVGYLMDGTTIGVNEAACHWLENSFAKVCLGVKDLAQLERYEERAKEAGLTVCKITDSGRTIFDGVPTITCLAIGPGFVDDINKVTGRLQLL